MWVDDFEGHWPKIEDVDDGRLVEIRKKTMEAVDDPVLLIQQPRFRGLVGAGHLECSALHYISGTGQTASPPVAQAEV